MAVPDIQRGKIALLAFGLFCVSLFLTAYSSRNPNMSRAGSTVLGEVFKPLQSLSGATLDGVRGLWQSYVSLIGLREENQLLKDRLGALETENSRLHEWEGENARLKTLLAGADEAGIQGVVARVIGYDPSNWVQAISINRGSGDGVKKHMAVVLGNAVVGQVISVSSRSSRVLLMIDHSSGVDTLVQSSRTRGVVEGTGREGCTLRYIPQEETVVIGDKILTSGMDGVFPKGLAVGVVSLVEKRGTGMFQAIKVKPAIDFSRLENVMVVTNVLVPEPEESPESGAKRIKSEKKP